MPISKHTDLESKNRKLQYCLITDRALYKQPLHEIAELAEQSSVNLFHLREKHLLPSELLQIAKHIRTMLIRTKFIVNGHLDVAIAAGADGVHLQKDNLPVAAVRKVFPELIIGYSAHSREELKAAEEAGADYAFLSPVFEGGSKISSLKALGIERFSEWARDCKMPVFALGGVTTGALARVAEAGGAGVAGISFFLNNGYFDSRGMVV